MNAELRAELLTLAEADQTLRRTWRELSPEANAAAWQEELARTARAGEVIEAHGWPGRSLVGEDGATAIWLLIQHADTDVELQERSLALLEQAVADGEASPRNLAYLTDRVRVNRGLPQVYGTQFGSDGPRPIEDPERLDERRASAGLEPFAEYEALMRDLNR